MENHDVIKYHCFHLTSVGQLCIECRCLDITTSSPCAARVRLHPFDIEAYLEATVLTPYWYAYD
jgi:hypothetical protein